MLIDANITRYIYSLYKHVFRSRFLWRVRNIHIFDLESKIFDSKWIFANQYFKETNIIEMEYIWCYITYYISVYQGLYNLLKYRNSIRIHVFFCRKPGEGPSSKCLNFSQKSHVFSSKSFLFSIFNFSIKICFSYINPNSYWKSLTRFPWLSNQINKKHSNVLNGFESNPAKLHV